MGRTHELEARAAACDGLAQVDEHNAVAAVVEYRAKLGLEPDLFGCGEVAEEHRVLEPFAEALDDAMDLAKSDLVSNVIGDNVTTAHPVILS